MKYKFFEHRADAEFESYGSTMEEVFENAALATFETMTDTSKVAMKVAKKFSINSEDIESLMYDFLERLIILHDSENLVFSSFKVRITGLSLDCEARGEEFTGRHVSRSVVKSVTYNSMKIGKKDNKFFAHIVLDV